MSVKTRHIAIDVRLDGDEISGRAGDGTDQPKAFQGWLGLLVALDGLTRPRPMKSPRLFARGTSMELSFGQRISGVTADGIELRAAVVDENQVRAAAGLTMVIGAVAFSYAYFDAALHAAAGRLDVLLRRVPRPADDRHPVQPDGRGRARS